MDERERKSRKLRELWGGVARQSQSSAETICPDPEVLSAYLMHMLGKEETALWEAHFSLCSGCQEAMAALVKTMSVEETALVSERTRVHVSEEIPDRAADSIHLDQIRENEPVHVADVAMAAAPEVSPATPQRAAVSSVLPKTSLRDRISWRWFVPAVAASLVFAVWLTVRLGFLWPQRGAEVAENKPATQSANPATAEKAPAAAPPAAEDKEIHEAARLGATPINGATTNPSLPAQGAPKKTPGPGASATTEADSLHAAKRSDSNSITAAAPGPSPVSPPADKKIEMADGQRASLRQEETAPAKKAAADVGALSQAAPPPPQPAERSAKKVAAAEAPVQSEAAPPVMAYQAQKPAAGSAIGGAAQTLATTHARATLKERRGAQFFAPGRKVVWSVGPGGLVLRSPDGGVSWMREESGVNVDLLSGSAPSETVCWVVGRMGTILLTTDGEHWTKTASPGTQDWIGVQAMDALHAIVWDLNRAHKFSTSDGGQTWQGAAQ